MMRALALLTIASMVACRGEDRGPPTSASTSAPTATATATSTLSRRVGETKPIARDGDLSVRCKPISKKVDQSMRATRRSRMRGVGVWTKADSVTYFDDLIMKTM